MTPRRAWLWLLVLAITLGGGFRAESEDLPDSKDELELHRVFVPDQWMAKLTQGYVAIKQQTLTELLAKVRRRAEVIDAEAHVAKAAYQARLVGDELVSGTAEFRILHLTDTPALIPLDPCSLAIGEFRWNDNREAVWGADSGGRSHLLVEKAGRLKFNWTMKATRSTPAAKEFDLNLPRSASSTLLLEVPADSELRVNGAAVARRLEVEPDSDPELRTWQVEMGGRTNVQLRILANSGAEQTAAEVAYRQDAKYSLSMTGLELSVMMALDVRVRPLESLTLSVSPELHLISATAGEQQLLNHAFLERLGQENRLTIEFPQPIRGVDQKLELSFFSPLTGGKNWRLPNVQPLGLLWEEGTRTITLAPELELRNLSTRSCQQRDATRTRQGERSLSFQNYAAGATADVIVDFATPPLQVRSGAVLQLEANKVTARLVADISCPEGSVLDIPLRLNPGWVIESIRSEPSDALHEELFTNRKPGSVILAPLREPVTKERSIRIVIDARRRFPRQLSLADLRVARFPNTVDSEHLVQVLVRSQQQLQLVRDRELHRLDQQQLDVSQLSRLIPNEQGLLLLDNERSDGTSFSLRNEEPAYSAVIRSELSISDQTATELFELEFDPESLNLSRLLVHLSEAQSRT